MALPKRPSVVLTVTLRLLELSQLKPAGTLISLMVVAVLTGEAEFSDFLHETANTLKSAAISKVFFIVFGEQVDCKGEIHYCIYVWQIYEVRCSKVVPL